MFDDVTTMTVGFNDSVPILKFMLAELASRSPNDCLDHTSLSASSASRVARIDDRRLPQDSHRHANN